MAYESRRLKVVYVPERFVLDAFMVHGDRPPTYTSIPTITGLPEGARIVRVYHEPMMLQFAFVIEHELFEEVPEGARVPEWQQTVDTIYLQYSIIRADERDDFDEYRRNKERLAARIEKAIVGESVVSDEQQDTIPDGVELTKPSPEDEKMMSANRAMMRAMWPYQAAMPREMHSPDRPQAIEKAIVGVTADGEKVAVKVGVTGMRYTPPDNIPVLAEGQINHAGVSITREFIQSQDGKVVPLVIPDNETGRHKAIGTVSLRADGNLLVGDIKFGQRVPETKEGVIRVASLGCRRLSAEIKKPVAMDDAAACGPKSLWEQLGLPDPKSEAAIDSHRSVMRAFGLKGPPYSPYHEMGCKPNVPKLHTSDGRTVALWPFQSAMLRELRAPSEHESAKAMDDELPKPDVIVE